ncbi:MAG: septal ring factor EnvC (AmiA/AmiB activator) [Kiritimatiellia bacterium]
MQHLFKLESKKFGGKSSISAVAGHCVAVFFLGASLSFSQTLLADTEAEYQQRLKALSSSIKVLHAELKTTKNSKDKLQQSLQTSEQNMAGLSKKIANIKEALAREKKQLTQLQAQRAKLDKHRQGQQQQIINTIRQAYQLGRQSQLKLLLNQEDPERLGRLVKYHDYIVNAHQRDVDAYITTIDELAVVERTIITATQKLEKQQQRLTKRSQELQLSQKQRLTTLAKLTSSLKQKGQQLRTLSADRQRLEDLLVEATNALANLRLPSGAQAFSQVKGKLPMPTNGKVLFAFGSPQFDGKLKRKGIFISNRTGAEVVSVHHGRVIFSDYLRGHGLLLILDHGDGYMSLYGHNQTLLKETGDWASPGETIATVGNTGGQQKVGLYFEIRHQGRPQNPRSWLKRG